MEGTTELLALTAAALLLVAGVLALAGVVPLSGEAGGEGTSSPGSQSPNTVDRSPTEGSFDDAMEEKIFEAINRKREERGLEPLKWNEKVAGVARERVKRMAAEGRFAHTNGDGEKLQESLVDRGDIFFITSGEALYYTEKRDPRATEVIESWMQSPGHRALIMDYDRLYDEGGVGVYCLEGAPCYMSAALVGKSKEGEVELRAGNVAVVKLYDEAFPFDFPVGATVEVESGRAVDIYFMPHDDQDFFMGEGCYWRKWENTRTLSRSLVVGKDNGLAIVNRGQSGVDVHYSIEYGEPQKTDRPSCVSLDRVSLSTK